MTVQTLQRKLAAILSADVKGYSLLMGQDEEETVRTLKTYRGIIGTIVQKHRGRVVDSPGDNLLAEFASVIEAVRCAVAIQEELRARNADRPEDRRMEFRIGVNLGDVIVEEDMIYGDGVNIAARIEGLAEGGGISISGTVYDQVENKLALQYESLGEHTVKNIKKPVRVYRVRVQADAVVSETSRELMLPEKPSIAVLPFVNISGDPEQEYFSDGITEDLITDLSKVSGLFVIARNSVFTYKGKSVKVDHVGRELGVRHVLEGSVRRAGDRLRITAQLVDASTGGHLWAERYDRDLKDIFALQDEVTQKIVTALAVKLTEGEEDRLTRKDTENLEAYDCTLRAMDYFSRATKEANAEARQMLEKAITLDPEYALAYSRLGRTHIADWNSGWSQDPHSLEEALRLAQRAIALDNSLADGHSLLGEVYLWKKQHDRAVAELEKTITLDPNNADWLADLGYILLWAGRPKEAFGLTRKAMRLNPLYPPYYLFHLGHAHFLTGEYEEAVAAFKRAYNRNPDFWPARAYLAASYVHLGQIEKARAETAKLKGLSPDLSLEVWRERLPYKDRTALEHLLDPLCKAGMK
jgi:adenylate cyclase